MWITPLILLNGNDEGYGVRMGNTIWHEGCNIIPKSRQHLLLVAPFWKWWPMFLNIVLLVYDMFMKIYLVTECVYWSRIDQTDLTNVLRIMILCFHFVLDEILPQIINVKYESAIILPTRITYARNLGTIPASYY